MMVDAYVANVSYFCARIMTILVQSDDTPFKVAYDVCTLS